ncbi:YqbF domain-containing protein [Bacillus swezeyi]|uniref:Uncharacterized protein YqbF N-terminal domain-containing protein n=1 Tax=Bacillus swezeyi TaxID=1925020 RepID=A0A5M8S0U7_9BACI|nr:YqbF domain-containing protein [Bacillus swezeyi]KAA6453213.1 hypothetical protein DX927_03130 [Bacillus swezeyi]KAA6476169.1 hypothetical protein DX928_08790 [Bacillus swezeyi]TYS38583.1 hypothetical protein FZC77_03020 [Bacillus swezeyi]
MYSARLVKGRTYDVKGCRFRYQEEQPISREIYRYVKENPCFEVKETRRKMAKARGRMNEDADHA